MDLALIPKTEVGMAGASVVVGWEDHTINQQQTIQPNRHEV